MTDTDRSPKPGRYTHAFLARMVACSDCGAVVMDTGAHDDWHDRINAGRSSEGDPGR